MLIGSWHSWTYSPTPLLPHHVRWVEFLSDEPGLQSARPAQPWTGLYTNRSACVVGLNRFWARLSWRAWLRSKYQWSSGYHYVHMLWSQCTLLFLCYRLYITMDLNFDKIMNMDRSFCSLNISCRASNRDLEYILMI